MIGDTQTEQTVSELFEQLGLPSDDKSIDRFIAEKGPIPSATGIADAEFWNDSQSEFLRNALATDGQWAIAVDRLDARLRG